MAFLTPAVLLRPTKSARTNRAVSRRSSAKSCAAGQSHAQPATISRPAGGAGIRLGALRDADEGVQHPGITEAVPHRLSLGEQARTVVHVCSTGTLCTSSSDHSGTPFGSHVDYVLTDEGKPAMLLATRAAHTKNLEQESTCSLFCQSTSTSGQDGCRATLLGTVRKATSEEVEEITERYIDTHAHAADALGFPAGLFEFHVMDVSDVFFVGGFGVVAQWVGAEPFLSAIPDPLCFDVPDIVRKINSERSDDLQRLCKVFLGLDDIISCNIMGLDRLGFDLRVRDNNAGFQEYRVAFREIVSNRFDVQSALVKTFQEAWEREMGYAESWADDDERPAFMYYSNN